MKSFSIFVGKTAKKLAQLRGSGSAFPGLVVEKIDPGFLQSMLKTLSHGVVVILGTNGKTTTTKIVSELLEKQGLKVFTNKTGSNFVRGVISEILDDTDLRGKFDYDIAVLELDEAHAVRFCNVADIDYALILNVQRDQLDRFGEIDHTADLLSTVASHASKCVVLNREDQRVSKIEGSKRVFFGLSDKLIGMFPADDNLLNKTGSIHAQTQLGAKVILSDLAGNHASYNAENETCSVDLTLKGIYNAYNAAAALALVSEILPDAKFSDLVNDLSDISSAFGRGEVFELNGCETELFLVKNPAAFQLGLKSFADDQHDFMIAINDNTADGHDVSWLWNVDFSELSNVKVASGIRAQDMALRLKYDNISTENVIESIPEALSVLSESKDRPKRIFATYTAMLEIRRNITGRSIL